MNSGIKKKKYNYLFSNEPNKNGVVVEIKKDFNFGFMLHILSNNLIERVPYSIIEYNKL